MKKKIITVLGARPQFIKAAVLSRVIKKHNDFEEIIVHTGQHFDKNMSDVFFEEMEIPKPKYNLEINNFNHATMTGMMMIKIEEILVKEQPHAVVVYGDTNSTLAGALTAKKINCKVIHIEAGLRSFNMQMPEEINRIVTDRIADLLSCPTKTAVNNLMKEGFQDFDCLIENHGDIMKDAVEYYSKTSQEKSAVLNSNDLENKQFVLATVHRQENTNDEEKLKSIFAALEKIHQEIEVVLPLHPRTKKVLKQLGLQPKIKLINPVGYFDMLELLKHCSLVFTDSGGLQKEAFFNKKHCVILRDETEWTELVSNDFATISGNNEIKIYKDYQYLISKKSNFNMELYGDNVGEKIYESIKNLILK